MKTQYTLLAIIGITLVIMYLLWYLFDINFVKIFKVKKYQIVILTLASCLLLYFITPVIAAKEPSPPKWERLFLIGYLIITFILIISSIAMFTVIPLLRLLFKRLTEGKNKGRWKDFNEVYPFGQDSEEISAKRKNLVSTTKKKILLIYCIIHDFTNLGEDNHRYLLPMSIILGLSFIFLSWIDFQLISYNISHNFNDAEFVQSILQESFALLYKIILFLFIACSITVLMMIIFVSLPTWRSLIKENS